MGKIGIKQSVGHARLTTYGQQNASVAVSGTDVSDFESACLVIEVGAHTADGMSIAFQESDDNSTYTDIADADMDGSSGWSQDLSITTSNDNTTYYVGYKGNKKYIGVTLTDAGSGDAIFGCYVIKGNAKVTPQNS